MSKNQQIESLNKLGQSAWYDNLSRDLLNSGELAALIDSGVSGLTSNPTIFQKAILNSSEYDVQLKSLAASGHDAEVICEEMMIEDVGRAADLLRPVYESSNAADGYASIEVSPNLANDTDSTIASARQLWSKLSRPNCMIKVPATEAGLPAIRALIRDGINVNVTLIFSLEIYKKVVDAYLLGLEDRSADGNSIENVSSVASFFVSRVDAIVEKECDRLIAAGKLDGDFKSSILGKVGIANSKLAYNYFEDAFGSERFAVLRAKNARVQRPLWASTGTKNPDFSPVLYVEELAGKDTVNTLPPATLDALMAAAQIEPRLHSGFEQATALIGALEQHGIDFGKLLVELQEKGVESFSSSYDDLVSSIDQKRKQVA